MRTALSIFIVSVFVKCWFAVANSIASSVEKFDDIKTVPHDTRSYRGLVLPNKLKVMLISDPATPKSAASMVVGVGSLHDFEHVDGLATLAAWVLLRKSPKYPEPNDYEKFIRRNDGKILMQVNGDQQSFGFEIDPEKLHPALDRFAHLFRRSSLDDLNEDDLDAAVTIVENDYKMCKENDHLRIEEVERLLIKENDKYNNFFHGNRETLYYLPGKTTLMDNLKRFHSRFYSSRIMSLAVLGKETLNTLESMVTSLFQRIEDKDVKQFTYKEKLHPWGAEQLKRKVYIVPKNSKLQILHLVFLIPNVSTRYDSGVLLLRHFLSHQLQYSGPGGLSTILKRRNWCHNIKAYGYKLTEIGFLRIDCDLTDKGLTKVDDVIGLIFQYLYLLSDKGSSEYLLVDMIKIKESRNILGKDPLKVPIDTVGFISRALRYPDIPMEEIVQAARGQHLTAKKDWSQIRMLLHYLKPNNMNVTIVSKSFEGKTDKTERNYSASYKIEDIPDEQIDAWYTLGRSDELKLPPRNKFLPQNAMLYDIGKNEPQQPYLIHKTSSMEVWFKQDDEFRVPLLHVWMEMLVPWSIRDGLPQAIWSIYWVGQCTHLVEHMYSAREAGFTLNYEPQPSGIHIHVYGYSETMLLYLKEFLAEMRTLATDMNTEQFEEAKRKLIENLEDRHDDDDISEIRVKWYRRHFLQEQTWSLEVSRLNAKLVQFDHVKELSRKWFSRVFVRTFVYGNYTRKKVKDVVKLLQNVFQPKREFLQQELRLPREVQMEVGSHYIYQRFMKGLRRHWYLTFFQFNTEPSTPNNLMSSLLVQIIISFCQTMLKRNYFDQRYYSLDIYKYFVEMRVLLVISYLFSKKYLSPRDLSITYQKPKDNFIITNLLPISSVIYWESLTFRGGACKALFFLNNLPNVHCIELRRPDFLGLTITVGSLVSPRVVDNNVKQFFNDAFSALKRMTITELAQHKAILRKTSSVKPLELSASQSYWHKISGLDDGFDIDATLLRSVKKPQLVAFFKEYFVNRRSELTILEFPEGTSSEVTNDIPTGAVRIKDFTTFINYSILLQANRKHQDFES